MKIIILSMCNFMGRPAGAGDVIEAISPAEMEAAGYLVSIGKARVVEAETVIEVDAEEEPDPADTLTPDPSPMQGEGSDEDEE